ncbi:MAG: hypothetical protein GQ564_08600 [Bacteroidales bacterium]|nr:hypothetical protein [Bacteroidales bacterium]
MKKLILLSGLFLVGLCFSSAIYAQGSTSEDEYVVRKKNSARVNGCGPDGSSESTVKVYNAVLGEKNCTPHDKKYGTKDYPKTQADNEAAVDIFIDNAKRGNVVGGAAKAATFKAAMSTPSSQRAYDNAQNRAVYEEKSTKTDYNNAGHQKKQCIDEKDYYVRKKTATEKTTGVENSEY